MRKHIKKHGHHAVSTLSLFTSASTLVCCALPALLVTLGAGAALISLTSAVPQLIWISRHKIEVFSYATVMLSLSGYLLWRARNAPCPTDQGLAKACGKQRKWNKRIYFFSLTMYAIGGFFSFIAPSIFYG
ncbi:MAG: hypothetical protein ACOYJ2_03820 [Rickettsiales bacterium]